MDKINITQNVTKHNFPLYEGWYDWECDIKLDNGINNPSSEPEHYYNNGEHLLGSLYHEASLLKEIRTRPVKKRNTSNHIRGTSKYQKVMKSYRKTHNYCELTGTTNVPLHIHHLNNIKEFPEKSTDTDNLIMIREDIHLDFHNSNNTNKYHCTEDDFWVWWNKNKHNYLL